MDLGDVCAVIDEALEHSGRTHALADVWAMIEAGEAFLWVGAHAALVSIISEYPLAKVHQLWLAGGDLAEIRETLVPQAEAWGAEHGCSRTSILGRPGWERELKGRGFAPAARLLIKEHAS